MEFGKLLKATEGLPIIESELLCAGCADPGSIKVQISRWQKAGKIIQLKRGVYLLAAPYRKTTLYEPHAAGILKRPSYISLEKALEYYDLIPEAVAVYTCVTPKRPGRFSSEVGSFDYRHIQGSLFWGYDAVTLNQQTAFWALPEKALLDSLDKPQYAGGIEEVFAALDRAKGKIDAGKLVEYALAFKTITLLQRLGFIADILKIPMPKSLRRNLFRQAQKGQPIALAAPHRFGRNGEIQRDWKIVQNVPKDILRSRS